MNIEDEFTFEVNEFHAAGFLRSWRYQELGVVEFIAFDRTPIYLIYADFSKCIFGVGQGLVWSDKLNAMRAVKALSPLANSWAHLVQEDFARLEADIIATAYKHKPEGKDSALIAKITLYPATYEDSYGHQKNLRND